MSNLPTNYVDDVLNADVNTRRKYQMIQNGDGTVSLVDVTDYDTVGSSIGAAQINAQNTQINQNTEDISSLNQHLTANNNPYVASYQNGKYGFMVGNKFLQIGGGGMIPNFNDYLGSTVPFTATKNTVAFISLSCILNSSNLAGVTVNGNPVLAQRSGDGMDSMKIELSDGDVLNFTGSILGTHTAYMYGAL